MFLGSFEQLSDQFGPIAKILLNEFRANHSQKSSWSLVSDSFGQQSFSSSRFSVENNSFWRFDSHVFVDFWVSERELNCLFDLLNLIF